LFAENSHDRHISEGKLFAAFSVRCTCGSETLVLLRNVAGKDISVDTIESYGAPGTIGGGATVEPTTIANPIMTAAIIIAIPRLPFRSSSHQ